MSNVVFHCHRPTSLRDAAFVAPQGSLTARTHCCGVLLCWVQDVPGGPTSARHFAFNLHVEVGTMADISKYVEPACQRGRLCQCAGDTCTARADAGIIHYDLVVTLLDGPAVTGKLALAATIARTSEFPFTKLIARDNIGGFSEPRRSGTCGPTLLQCGTADPHGTHGRASRKGVQSQVRRLVIATTSLHPILADIGLTSFDAKSRVAPITADLTVFDRILEAVELFHSTCDRRHAVSMPRQASIGAEDAWLRIGIKRLLGVVEMARQDSQAFASSLMASGCEDMIRDDGTICMRVCTRILHRLGSRDHVTSGSAGQGAGLGAGYVYFRPGAPPPSYTGAHARVAPGHCEWMDLNVSNNGRAQ
ncbi:hypothetical protein EDB92DRAFT_2106197 [Lactarius akahatsu]|uniref:Vesicular-fusion protein SEC18 n=1 Tax=Lactarius akahatsu TaxID=416441 RepID=A0AAD4LCZ9_9AGAM|nr:hypothetical protein EDB92DRAFT_2106197 [Lactarius akahatsu]